MMLDWFPASTGKELLLLGIAFMLSALIGAERQWHRKSAGLRTHTLVGVGSAIFTLVSAYGFSSVTAADSIVDPSRIAAQVVSGIGFLGAGVIFVRQDVVNGLTTAASIWITAAIGMACGAEMPVVAIAGTALHFITTGLLSKLGRIRAFQRADTVVVQYKGGREVLQAILTLASRMGYKTSLSSAKTLEEHGKTPRLEAVLEFGAGRRSLERLVREIADVKGVVSVSRTPDDLD